MKKSSTVLAGAWLCTFAAFADAQVVSVTSGPGPQPPKARTVVYQVQCSDNDYTLRYRADDKTLSIQAAKQQTSGLTGTSLGKSFANQALYGRTSLSCLPGAVSVQFMGYDISRGTPAPVEFHAIVSAGGDVTGGEIVSSDQRTVSGIPMP